MVAGANDRVVRQVGNGEVVVRRTVRVLVVDVATPPVRQAESGAAGEDVVRPDVVRRLGERTDGLQSAAALWRVGPVDLVVPEAGP